MAMFLKCNRTGTLFFSTKEAEKHAEDTGFQDFAQVAADAPVFVAAAGRKLKLFWEMEEFTRFKQRTRADDLEAEPMSVSEYKQRLDSLESMPAGGAAASAAMDVDGGGGGGGGGAAAAAPMEVDEGTVGAQTLGMLPGVEALEEPGDAEGQTKMVRILDDAGNMVAAVYKWAAKEQKWNKHKEIVDEDQPAAPEEIEKALAVVNTELLGPLMEMGFPEARCKKALLITGNDSVEHGIQWLTDHVEDPLADAPLTIAQVKKALKPKLTPEEKAAKAAELQRKAKAEREKREALEAVDREKRKREGVKKTTEQQRQLDEIERKRFIEGKKREKEKEKVERERIKAKLAADRAERGFAAKEEPPDKAKADFLGNKKVAVAPKLRAELRSIKNDHGDKKDAAFKALLAYVSNIIENPQDPKFRRVNLTNKAFVGRVASCGEHGVNFLTLCGFKGGGRAEYIPEGKDPAGFIVCQTAEEGGNFDEEWIPTLKAARTELTKSIENPFWL